MKKRGCFTAFVWLTIVACIAAVGALILVHVWFNEHDPLRDDDPPLAIIEANAEIKLPPSASDIDIVPNYVLD